MKHPLGKRTENGSKIEWIELRNNGDETADILAYIEMPRGSVLAGQIIKVWQDCLPIEEAVAAYPDAQFYHPYISIQPCLNHLEGEEL